ncbi:MAG TPA: GrlR family regulatory protein [Candidatus Acidoferrales bacterium]
MIDGLWVVQFQGPSGTGGGVAVFRNSQILGGDSAYLYVGTFRVSGDAVTAEVFVKNFNPDISNVLGIPGNFHLIIEGKITGDEIKGTGALREMPDSKMVVRLNRETTVILK